MFYLGGIINIKKLIAKNKRIRISLEIIVMFNIINCNEEMSNNECKIKKVL